MIEGLKETPETFRQPGARVFVACYFNTAPDGADQWSRLARVLDATVRRHCLDWDVRICKITPPPARSAAGSIAYEANTQKLDHWTEVVMGSPDGTEIVLSDADAMVTGPLDSAFEREPRFDFAYTVRDPSASLFPLNAGVIFLRASANVRKLMWVWREENRKMLADPAYHRPWNRKYAGINQAALGRILEERVTEMLGLQLATLPCAEWNCEDSAWRSFDPSRTRIVHLKSALRRSIFNLSATPPELRGLRDLWRETEREIGRKKTA